MSFEERLTASIRGVEFLLNTVDGKGGRRAIPREYPKRESGWTEDHGAILTNERGFCGCGTGIDSEIAVSFVSGKISRYNIVDALAGQECIVLLLVFKQRFETGNLKIDGYFFFEPFFQREKRNLGLSICIHCRTDGCKQMRVVRHDRVLVIQL